MKFRSTALRRRAIGLVLLSGIMRASVASSSFSSSSSYSSRDVTPSEVSKRLGNLEFNPRDDFEVSLNGGAFVHSSNTPHHIYYPLQEQIKMSIEGDGEEFNKEQRLHVFLTGTGAPALARDLCKDFLSTSTEFNVPTIALSYEWLNLTDSARNSLIENDVNLDLENKHLALKLCHRDICFGTNSEVNTPAATGQHHQVHLTECISQRLVRLLTYLHFEEPEQGWDRYLLPISKEEALKMSSDSVVVEKETSFVATIDWSKIVLSGHSQGAGHAAYIGMHRPVGRVVLFSGPQEGLIDDKYDPQKLHWLHEKTDFISSNMLALKHAYEEGTTELIWKNWLLMPSFEGLSLTEDVVTVKSTLWEDHLKGIHESSARRGELPKLFETWVPYRGYREGVVKPGRPYHGSTVIDGSTPLSTPGGQETLSAYKKILWSYLLIGDIVVQSGKGIDLGSNN